jgi:hypothetical protein
MKKILALALMALTACGGLDKQYDPELATELAELQEECPAFMALATQQIKFGDTHGSIGICQETFYPFGEADRVVTINKNYWDKTTNTNRKALLAHELLHCEYRLKDLYSKSDENNWMYWRAVAPEKTVENWAANVKQYCH